LVQLQEAEKEWKSAGIQVVGISFDKVATLKSFSDARKINYPLLSDEGSKTIQQYGLLFKRGLPHPGTIVISRDGVIQAKLFEDGYVKRHAVDELVKAAKALP
jgi:peroxiredoxin